MNYKKSKEKIIHGIVSKFLLIAVCGSVVVGISLYSNNVRLAKNLSEVKASIDEMEDELANNKSSLYGLTDFQDLENTVLGLGLIRELNPSYLDLGDVNQLSLGL